MKHEPYKMILDFDTRCGKCGKAETIWITSGDPNLPSFHFCSCQYPTFTLTQDGVGDVPSFARADGALRLATTTKRGGVITEQARHVKDGSDFQYLFPDLQSTLK